ncbi:MAG: YfhO family protein [Myxococcota bacterium]
MTLTARLLRALAFLGAPIALFGPYLLGQRRLGGPDFEETYLPWQLFLSRELAHGRLPSWNPYVMLGKPVWGEVENALLYPPRWMLFFRPGYTISLFWILHLAVAHAGAYRLGRVLGASRFGSWLGGLAFCLSGWVASHLYANHAFLVATASWFPLLVSQLLVSPAAERWHRWTVALFAIASMIVQGGSPQLAYQSFFAALAFVVALAPARLADRRWQAGTIVALGAAIVVALPHGWATHLEHLESTRAGAYPLELATGFSFSWARLGEWVVGPSPAWIARPDAAVYETGVFLGAIPVLLAAAAVALRARSALALWALALVFVALGSASPLWLFRAFRLLPGAASFRAPGRFLVFALAAMSAACALGWTVAGATLARRIRPSALTLVGGITALLIALPLWAHVRWYFPQATGRFRQVREAVMARTVLPGSAPFRVALDIGPVHPNWFWENGLEMVGGRAPLTSWRFHHFVERLAGPADPHLTLSYLGIPPREDGPFSLLAASRILSVRPPGELPALRPLAFAPPYHLYAWPRPAPVVRFYARARAVPDRRQSLRALRDPAGPDPERELFYEGPPRPADRDAQGECRARRPSTDEWLVECATTGRGFLWISQAHHAGWQAWVNGTRAQVYPAHLLFQAVPIPRGASHVRLEFRPPSLRITLWLSLVGLSSQALLLLAGEWRLRRRRGAVTATRC